MINSKKTFIVAEIGKNFIQTKKDQSISTYLRNAKKLVDEAKKSGADAVKFQTHSVDDEQLNINITSPHFSGSDRYNWVKRNTFPVKTFWQPLKKYCDQKEILFFSTPMSRGAVKILQGLDAKLWKVGSGDILDFVMLDSIRNTGKPIIISSGMSTLGEIKKSVNFLRKKNENVTLLHCVSRYPCPPGDLNLKTISYFKKKFNIPVGFSDHSLGGESAIAAVALGAGIIEKHFSFSRKLWGPDHKVSMTPKEFKSMAAGIRRLENNPAEMKKYLRSRAMKKYMGKTGKYLQKGESLFRPVFRKSLVASTTIARGSKLSSELIYAMRPAKYSNGLNSEHYEKVLGRKTTKDLKKYDPITSEVINH